MVWYVCMYVWCVCGQELEFLVLPALPVCASAPDHNMIKQLWDARLRVHDEAEKLIDFKHHKREFPITTKVRAANC